MKKFLYREATMKFRDRLLYDTIAVPLIYGSLKIVSLFSRKVKRGFRERRDVWERLTRSTEKITEEMKPRFWIHSSSAGEFLQSIPVLEEIKANWPEAVIFCTYFSPSADALVRASTLVDIPSYLPIDSRENAGRIFSLLRPDILLFSRYDVWPNLMWEASRRRCPAVLINATLNRESSRMKLGVKGFSGRLYSDLELICAASEEDRENFLSIGVPAWKVEVTGDTKYDETFKRVTVLPQEKTPLESYLSDTRVIIGGSTWPPDEKYMLSAFANLKKTFHDLFLMIVPHEPTKNRVKELIRDSSSTGCRPETYSELRDHAWQRECDVLIVDQVGFLARLYRSAQIAVVGGGFTRGVHNVLEPAALGIPVLMGPNYGKSPEAVTLCRDGGAKMIDSEEAMEATLSTLLSDSDEHKTMGEMAKHSVRKNLNATEHTLAVLRSTFPILFPTVKREQ